MRLISSLAIAAIATSAFVATPAAADPGRGHHKHKSGHKQDRHEPYRSYGYIADCPPGLAKKHPRCVPPGQARKHASHYGNRVGDVLRVGDYVIIRDPRRYDLQDRRGWDYYRDDNRIYRVDSGTQKVLAVMNLIQAFSN
ncbi:hypothetical protein [Paracoccus aestuariivivens]|uniref:Excinuclease ABC subunit A n=1 Tax=Paracoccus aestuariivivens TaxID=1820333 RepID=A0A6L6JGF6_9RHOB|nr:hypothetical protein [Paracoccus aestuariivivens]MTH79214.1 hypothetical protein [Paracoccus aestuariivivens]